MGVREGAASAQHATGVPPIAESRCKSSMLTAGTCPCVMTQGIFSGLPGGVQENLLGFLAAVPADLSWLGLMSPPPPFELWSGLGRRGDWAEARGCLLGWGCARQLPSQDLLWLASPGQHRPTAS